MYNPVRACLGMIAAAVALSGCASKPDVISAGKDHGGQNLYAIAGQTDLNASASRTASQYCQRRGQAAVIQDSGFRDSGFTFSCDSR